MKKKQALTLIEMMIVIFLIGIIASVVGYNMIGSMEKGKAFKTEQGIRRLTEIVNLEISLGGVSPKSDDAVEVKRERVSQLLRASQLVRDTDLDSLLKDGWGNYYSIDPAYGTVRFSSTRWEQYLREHDANHPALRGNQTQSSSG